jgi:hypothetical protein
MKRPFFFSLISIASLIFCGCGLIQVCIESPRDIANAYKYTDQSPLTVEGLRHLIKDDTAHYKVVAIYSHCCGPCHEQMKMTYSKLYNADTSHVRWYFVLNDCSSLKYDNTKFLKRFGIETPYMYYLRDDDSRFSSTADDRYLNIAKYVFDRQPEIEDVIFGIPCLFVVNPQGRLKTEHRRYADGMVVVGNVNWIDFLLDNDTCSDTLLKKLRSVTELDFDRCDTSDWSDMGEYPRKHRICTPDGCN